MESLFDLSRTEYKQKSINGWMKTVIPIDNDIDR